MCSSKTLTPLLFEAEFSCKIMLIVKLWNSLPVWVWDTVAGFKSRQKTHLSSPAFYELILLHKSRSSGFMGIVLVNRDVLNAVSLLLRSVRFAYGGVAGTVMSYKVLMFVSPLSYPVIARLVRHVHCLYLYTQHSLSPSVKLHMLLLCSQCSWLLLLSRPAWFMLVPHVWLDSPHFVVLTASEDSPTWTTWRYTAVTVVGFGLRSPSLKLWWLWQEGIRVKSDFWNYIDLEVSQKLLDTILLDYILL